MSDFPGEDGVLVVGAGPAGLAMAIELGHRGIPCLLVERAERAGHAPRAKTTHSRTREHLRRWGIADKLAAASPFGLDYPSHIHFVTRLGGQALHRFDHALDCAQERNEAYSEHGQWIPQYKLEAVLLEHARTLPSIEVRFGRELVAFEQDETGVTASIREVAIDAETGAETPIRAAYLVGADGARSRVRKQIGATMEGTHGLSRNYNIIFRAPGLAAKHPHGPGVMYWQINADMPSIVGPMDEGDLWFFMPTIVAEADRLDPAEAEALIRCSIGIDTEIEVLSSDAWVASRLLADRYRKERAFLIGDACHLHPPFGGFGMNLGVSDSVDLGWKMAAVLQGWAGPALLDSYEIERRQTHEIVLDAAEANHTILPNQLVLPHLEEDNPEGEAARAEAGRLIAEHKHAEFYARGVVLGYCYRDSPIVVDDGTQRDWQRSLSYAPSAIPGSVAPHRWLFDGTSLYDHFGDGLTLLVMSDDVDVAGAVRDARQLGVPLEVLHLSQDGLRDLYDAPLALIRPDQHVAWRGDAWPGSTLLERVTARGHSAVEGHGLRPEQ